MLPVPLEHTAWPRSGEASSEIDGANAAREFLRANGIAEATVGVVLDAIALHTTPKIPWHKRPEIALVTGGVEADGLGDGLGEISAGDHDASGYGRETGELGIHEFANKKLVCVTP